MLTRAAEASEEEEDEEEEAEEERGGEVDEWGMTQERSTSKVSAAGDTA